MTRAPSQRQSDRCRHHTLDRNSQRQSDSGKHRDITIKFAFGSSRMLTAHPATGCAVVEVGLCPVRFGLRCRRWTMGFTWSLDPCSESVNGTGNNGVKPGRSGNTFTSAQTPRGALCCDLCGVTRRRVDVLILSAFVFLNIRFKLITWVIR